MTMRQRRKGYWQFPATGVFMRAHMRKVKPLPLFKWVGNRLEKK